MRLKSTIRDYSGSIYARIPPAMVEYFALKDKINYSKAHDIEPECIVEEVNENEIRITFPKWC